MRKLEHRWRHVARGSTYEVLADRVTLEPAPVPIVEGTALHVYLGMDGELRATTAAIDGQLLWTAQLQAACSIVEGTVLVIYRADVDGSFWARPRDEFLDGRFVAIGPD